MKKTVVISEYNLFHRGHMRQTELIRRRDPDSCIIAVMSGNWVQRGEAACRPKYERARAAIDCGVDLVLELPYPWSGAVAENFAYGGVSLASDIGADALCFGSESGDIESLARSAERLDDSSFTLELSNRLESASDGESYIKTRDSLYREMYGERLAKGANDTLGIEYIRAKKRLGSNIEIFTVKREGVFSATETRNRFFEGDTDGLLEYMPNGAYELFCDKKPYSLSNAEVAVLHALRSGRLCFDGSQDESDIGARLTSCAKRVSTLLELYRLAKTKKYTDARIRRTLVSGMLGCSAQMARQRPEFTVVLAANSRGTAALREIKKKCTDINILTKPSKGKELFGAALEQFLFSAAADEFYTLCSPDISERRSDEVLRHTPYIKEE